MNIVIINLKYKLNTFKTDYIWKNKKLNTQERDVSVCEIELK